MLTEERQPPLNDCSQPKDPAGKGVGIQTEARGMEVEVPETEGFQLILVPHIRDCWG